MFCIFENFQDLDMHTIQLLFWLIFFKMNLLEEKGWERNFYYGTHLLAHIFADICFVTCQVLKLLMRVRNEKTTKEL